MNQRQLVADIGGLTAIATKLINGGTRTKLDGESVIVFPAGELDIVSTMLNDIAARLVDTFPVEEDE